MGRPMVEPEADGTASTAVADAPVRDHEMNSSDGVLVRVRTLLPEFTGALQRVADIKRSTSSGFIRNVSNRVSNSKMWR